MAILAAGQLINAAMGSMGFLLNMTGYERDVARTLLMTAGLNILLNLALIPTFGMAGAASATAVSLTLWSILLYRIVKRRIGINSTAFAVNRIN
ncbi:MAG: polysaccharide biosynthesis C-terminal domain-containing protein [Desulfobulbaceae bacterium]|nr:polysaccharide biosynthesis C-terminal domain-containing protein [Desulfobulbaceae bacterium]